MLNKKLMAVVVLLSVMCAAPLWGAQFRKVSDQQFIDMCQEGNTQGVIEAIRAGANVNAEDKDGNTALMFAVDNGHIEIVNALLKAGADVNAKGIFGMTALMVATEKGHTEIVNTLLKARADVNAKSIFMTALMIAASNGYTEIVNALLKAGADVNTKDDKFGMTALMMAAWKGHTETVNAILEAGADDLTDDKGRTALIYATIYIKLMWEDSNPATVNALIVAGSDVKHRDNDGNTALDYARKNPKLKGTDALKRLEELSR